MVIQRITLFQVKDKADIPKMLEEYYDKIPSAIKDGKKYVLSCAASETYDDKRSQGFNFAARTQFQTIEDMNFYDTDCSAHQALKAAVMPMVEKIMTVYWEQ